VIAIAIVAMEILVPYKRYVGVLKWLALLLLVYPITALLVKQDWVAILRSTIIPSISFDKDYLLTMVGFLGTTISPYLFFWQTSEEVEEEINEA
jgi:Mn2+/Fe2+ NRAMP family transporter